MGIANRGDFDLSNHTEGSGTKMQYFDQASGERYTPYVIEPSWGLTRSLMAFLVDAYSEDEAPNTKGGTEKRTVLRLDPRLAPVKAADRKSTRLNSSHVASSYADFCLNQSKRS